VVKILHNQNLLEEWEKNNIEGIYRRKEKEAEKRGKIMERMEREKNQWEREGKERTGACLWEDTKCLVNSCLLVW
jgi:hypothetical protein